jgi:hypothetical protein
MPGKSYVRRFALLAVNLPNLNIKVLQGAYDAVNIRQDEFDLRCNTSLASRTYRANGSTEYTIATDAAVASATSKLGNRLFIHSSRGLGGFMGRLNPYNST